jgi:predicted chitinase
MAGYIGTLTQDQRNNALIILKEARRKGITNSYALAALLSIASKECEFKLHKEASYAHTDNERIRAIFGHHFDGVTDDQLNVIKASDKLFFNKVYGNMYGNGPDNAWMYTGRGFNQITFLGNYKALGLKINQDLVNHPELLDNPEIAAQAFAQYFIDRFHSITAEAKAEAHTADINGFTNINDALIGIYHANAGWGKKVFPDVTGGFAKAKSRVGEFSTFVTSIVA